MSFAFDAPTEWNALYFMDNFIDYTTNTYLLVFQTYIYPIVLEHFIVEVMIECLLFVKSRFMSKICLDLYGSNLWKYSGHEVEQMYMHGIKLYVAYGKSLPLLMNDN